MGNLRPEFCFSTRLFGYLVFGFHEALKLLYVLGTGSHEGVEISPVGASMPDLALFPELTLRNLREVWNFIITLQHLRPGIMLSEFNGFMLPCIMLSEAVKHYFWIIEEASRSPNYQPGERMLVVHGKGNEMTKYKFLMEFDFETLMFHICLSPSLR